MTNLNETLKLLLISLNICSEDTAEQLSTILNSDESRRLITALKEGAGAKSHQSDTDLPMSSNDMTESQESKAIEARDQLLEKNDDEFIEGIKHMFAARNENKVSTLAAWHGEQSDEDFPRKISEFRGEVNNKKKSILETLKNRLKEDRIETKGLLKGHRGK